ncbi:MAG: hypothetical protein ACM3L9_09850, partial [Deltaproteobacteria bacterium]
MRRTCLVSLGIFALALTFPSAFAADPANPVPAAPSVETGSLGGADAAIGAAARKLIEPAPPAAQPLPAPSTNASSSEAAPPAAPAKPSPEELDRAALAAFYQQRGDAPLWVTTTGFTDKARLAIAELKRAADWGLDPGAFTVPDLAGTAPPEALAAAESSLSLATMAYARHARGGNIAKPSEQLSSYFDRRPQWKDRAELLSELASADDPGKVLAGLHPKHPQFELLRQAWLETTRARVAKGTKLPAGSDIKPGDSHSDIAILRKRLAVPAAEAATEQTYD